MVFYIYTPLYKNFVFGLHRVRIETYIDIRMFDNFLLLMPDLQIYYIASDLHSFPLVLMKIWRDVVDRALNREITCTNIEQDDENLRNKSGNILCGTFIDSKI